MSSVNRVLDRLPAPLVRRVVHRFWHLQEPELRRLDEYLDASRPAIDIGTWWGPWTAALAKRCPSVHSFEPQPQLAAQLRTWVPDHVTVHEAAVGAEPGRATLFRPDDLPGSDGLATLRDGGGADSVEVIVATIDDLDLPDVGFIKIDVEGFELPALHGASETIARCRPRLMIEIEQRHLDQPIDDVFAWFLERDFDGWLLRAEGWYPLADFDVENDQLRLADKPKRTDYINGFLFAPSEHSWHPPLG